MNNNIKAEIIVDTRTLNKANKYSIKIRVYDGISSHRYIALKKYQTEKKLVKDLFIRQREVELDLQLDYINKNGLNLEKSLIIIKEGIPALTSNQERIFLLEQELMMLKSKERSIIFVDYLEKFIQHKKEINQRFQNFTSLNKIFQEFKYNFTLDEVDYNFIEEYYYFNKSKNNTFAYFRLNINMLRNVYFDAIKKGLFVTYKANPFLNRNFVNYDKKKDFSLSLQEIRTLYKNIHFKRNHKGSNNELTNRALCLYLFLFAIGGHNFVELSHLKWKNIKKGRIEFYRQKMHAKGGGEFVDNFLSVFAMKIIENYGTKDSEYIFDFITDINISETKYKKCLYNFTYYLKIIVRELKISKSILSNSSRHTFNTIARNNLINTYLIEKIQGHKSKGMTFNYTGKIDYEVQDTEHKKILDLVFKD